jgi:hypothetical protein
MHDASGFARVPQFDVGHPVADCLVDHRLESERSVERECGNVGCGGSNPYGASGRQRERVLSECAADAALHAVRPDHQSCDKQLRAVFEPQDASDLAVIVLRDPNALCSKLIDRVVLRRKRLHADQFRLHRVAGALDGKQRVSILLESGSPNHDAHDVMLAASW